MLGCPPYAARPTLELLQGFNLLVRSARSGSYSLQPEVRGAGRLLGSLNRGGKVGHISQCVGEEGQVDARESRG